MAAGIHRPARDIETADRDIVRDPSRVVLYNDDIHAFDEVARQIRIATGVSEAAAYTITLIAHERGRAICFAGPADACERVADVLREIGLHVEVDRSSRS